MIIFAEPVVPQHLGKDVRILLFIENIHYQTTVTLQQRNKDKTIIVEVHVVPIPNPPECCRPPGPRSPPRTP